MKDIEFNPITKEHNLSQLTQQLAGILGYTVGEELVGLTTTKDHLTAHIRDDIDITQVQMSAVIDAHVPQATELEKVMVILDGLTSVIEMSELEGITPKLEWYGDKTFEQVKTYVENSVVDLASAKEHLVKLTLANLANLKLIRILCAMHLGQL